MFAGLCDSPRKGAGPVAQTAPSLLIVSVYDTLTQYRSCLKSKLQSEVMINRIQFKTFSYVDAVRT